MKEMRSRVLFMHTSQCHVWKTALEELEAALQEAGGDVDYEVRVINTNEEAEEYRFSGSPTILVDGVNVDPMARNIKKFIASGCRPYFYKGKTLEYPPKEMIVAALKQGEQAKNTIEKNELAGCC